MSEIPPTRKKAEGVPEAPLDKQDIGKELGKLHEEELQKVLKKLPGEYEKAADALVRKKKFGRREAIAAIIASAITAGVVVREFVNKDIQPQTEGEGGSAEKKETEKIKPPETEEEKIKILKKTSEYPKAIENSPEKQNGGDFIKKLGRGELGKFDALVIGALQRGYGQSQDIAARLLGECIKSGGKISILALQGLSSVKNSDVEWTEQFNAGKIGNIAMDVDNMERIAKEKGIFAPPVSLLTLARKSNIKIVGLEGGEKIENGYADTKREDLGKFREMSENAKKIVEENKGKGMAVFYVTHPHVTHRSWPEENLLSQLAGEEIKNPAKEDIDEYTLTESLKKRGYSPLALKIDAFKGMKERVESVARRGNVPVEKIREEIKNWDLKEKLAFVTPLPGTRKNENIYAMALPGVEY